MTSQLKDSQQLKPLKSHIKSRLGVQMAPNCRFVQKNNLHLVSPQRYLGQFHAVQKGVKRVYLCSRSASILSSPVMWSALILQLSAIFMFCWSSSNRMTSPLLIRSFWSFSICLSTDSMCCCFPNRKKKTNKYCTYWYAISRSWGQAHPFT